MNIFLTSPNPVECAQVLDDKRVVKMAVETAQLLATAVRSFGVTDIRYKATHGKHPCSLWAARSRGNFDWLCEHGIALCDEYQVRYGHEKDHGSRPAIFECFVRRDIIPSGELVFDFNSSGYDTGDVFEDYRLCLLNKWNNIDGKVSPRSRLPIWTNREPPSFLQENT